MYHGARCVIELEKRLRQLLEQFPEIAVAVLFGSHQTGRARPDSDLDVAILPSERCESRRKLQARISSVLADLAPHGRVDVVFIDEVPTLLRQRIMEAGRELVMRDSGAWRDWRVRTMREHGDRIGARYALRLGVVHVLAERGLVHVAKRLDLDTFQEEKLPQMEPAARAEADEPSADRVE